jgi:hypothetical protein
MIRAAAGVSADEVVAFRVAASGLAGPRPRHAPALGLQATEPDTPLLALAARRLTATTAGLTAVWGPRIATYLVPSEDEAVFTLALNDDDGDPRRIADAAQRHLRDGPKSSVELGALLAADLPDLAPWCRSCRRYHLNGGLMRMATWTGRVKRTPDGSFATGARRPPRVDRRSLRAELARRYLAALGPSTPVLFAEWSRMPDALVEQTFADVAGELVEVEVDGASRVARRADLPRLRRPPPATGVRLVPPHDPLLQLRDRELLVADEHARRHIWRAATPPGVVLADGTVAGTWRTRRRGRQLAITVEPWEPLDIEEVRGEAERAAGALGRTLSLSMT